MEPIKLVITPVSPAKRIKMKQALKDHFKGQESKFYWPQGDHKDLAKKYGMFTLKGYRKKRKK